jgi:hypothetical protein
MERPVGGISHMDQTYIKVKGVCQYATALSASKARSSISC